jgi:hypothetical protein
MASRVLSFIRCSGITLVLSSWGFCGIVSGVNYEVSCCMPQSFRPICAIERATFRNSELLIILSVIVRQYKVWFVEIDLKQSIKHKRVLYLMTIWRRITVCCTPRTRSQGRIYFGSSGTAVPGRRFQGTTKWLANKYFKWKNIFLMSKVNLIRVYVLLLVSWFVSGMGHCYCHGYQKTWIRNGI